MPGPGYGLAIAGRMPRIYDAKAAYERWLQYILNIHYQISPSLAYIL